MIRAMRAGPTRRLLLLVPMVASVACCAGAFVAAGIWAAACVVPLPSLLVLFRARFRGGWPAHVFLAAMVLAATAGALASAPALLVVPGAVLALAAWDLAELERFLAKNESADATPAVFARHVRSLARAIVIGVLFAAGGYALSLRIPFPLMFLLVVLDLACMGYFLRLMRK